MPKLIDGYDMTLVSPACDPGADRWSARACLDTDITEVLPYLNGYLKRADYYHDAKVLIAVHQGKKCAFRPREISVAPADDREEAVDLIEGVIRLVNDVWEKRDRIEPSCERIEPPTLMEIYKVLPRTNCGACGFKTCMAFATQVRKGTTEPARCTDLSAQGREMLQSRQSPA
jgi:ArsR family metal-binding transcriptional regulator